MAKTEALTRQQIELSIKKKEFFPIYVLSGEEPFYVDKLSEMIIDNALTEEEKDFNLSVYYASDTRMADVALACRRYPMMAERQVVVLREAQAWKSMNGVNEKKELEEKEKEAENLRNDENKAIDSYAKTNPLVRQIIDIALLGNNLLKGKALDEFLKRSVELLK